MRFSVSDLPPAKRLSALHALTHTSCDARPRGSLGAVDVSSAGNRVGVLIFGQVRSSPLHFRRGPTHLTARDQDFLVLEAMVEGEQRVTMDAGHLRMHAWQENARDSPILDAATSEWSLGVWKFTTSSLIKTCR